MSRPNVEAVRAAYEAWSRGDFGAKLDLLDPDIVFVVRPEFPDAGTYVGLAELGRYMRSFLEPWVRLTIHAEEIIEVGERIVAAVCQRATGEESGIPGELRYFQVWSFSGGKVVRIENVRDRAEALAVASVVE